MTEHLIEPATSTPLDAPPPRALGSSASPAARTAPVVERAGADAAKAWGLPLVALDRAWTGLERRLAVWVILAEIVTLVGWVALKGFASYYSPDGDNIGLIFRSILSAILLGSAVHLVTRPRPHGGRAGDVRRWHPVAVTAATVAGLLLGRAWVHVGCGWAANVTGWLLNASVPALIGGPRGVVTRLTLWLALLGGSLAASRGKHINIDVATRYLPQPLVVPVATLGWLAAALVCFTASAGFVDSIAVTKFRAEAFHACPSKDGSGEGAICDTTVASRLETTLEGMRTDLFLLGRQISLDAKTIPHVITGDPYDRYLSTADWNAWVQQGGWERRFPKESVAAILAPTDDPAATKMPAVVAPDTGEGRDLLIRDLDFILPFGLLVIGLKLVLRVLRVLSGHVRVDPDAAHDEEDFHPNHGAAEEGAI